MSRYIDDSGEISWEKVWLTIIIIGSFFIVFGITSCTVFEIHDAMFCKEKTGLYNCQLKSIEKTNNINLKVENAK